MIEALFLLFIITSLLILLKKTGYMSYIPKLIYKVIDDNSSKILLENLKRYYDEDLMK
tara:strand:- start:826 stop:999 length:174 start_codon:yes stop_codon:yes gene_type:complete